MELRPSACQKGMIGIAGHVGVGHAFSHSGFFQEDSGGFAVLLTLLDRACPLDIEIASVRVLDGEHVVVTTRGGGTGSAWALHGFTPYEESLMQQAVRQRCAAPQTLASLIFGRVYGQGAGTQACAFCLAAAKAMLDTVRTAWPYTLASAPEDMPNSCGEYLGGVIDINGIPASWLLTINATCGGIGPNEDAEGCVPIGNKAQIMRALDMENTPLLVLEGKAYMPTQEPPLAHNALFVRWNGEYDNPVSGQCYERAARESGYPVLVQSNTYPRMGTSLSEETQHLGQRIVSLGEAYGKAETAAEKIELMAELATLCSHDAGGSIFMSDAVHRYAGNGGLWPGLGAMLSLIVTEEEARTWKSLRLTQEELDMLTDVLARAASYLYERREEALAFVSERRPRITGEDLLRMISRRCVR
ncbi:MULTISPECIES: hypothetical protein [unclassified Desulfovibrio]|uniref:hypothetical protein n=1 Tax=unclassified Desulfovibrio TaxID=2593640 RepID=UPI000F5F203E|nr:MULTISPECIES: hypothetical protein [unclassified Desulfovibrio]RRD70774.1 hypothetical protein EII24_05875 [Desulfovibrio sp. OH1209_COT-279]RRD87176.1 hypothetical protein EII23_05875 [Desulfovibrio sp. OH1186_COT-070]